MTPSEYEAFVQSKIGTPLDCSLLGLAGECGELIDLVKKERYHGHPFNREKLLNEAGDILFYLSDILRRYVCATIPEAMSANKKKLDERYSGKFTKEESQMRRDVK